MKEFIVNGILEEGGATHGVVASKKDVAKNLNTMFGADVAAKFLVSTDRISSDFISIGRFCQYVGVIKRNTEDGLTMRLSDFKGDVVNALEEYFILQDNDWDMAHREKFSNIANDIINNTGEIAKLVVRPLPKNFLNQP